LPNTTAAVPNHGGWYFTDASLENAKKLVRYLMKMYDVPKENVVRHYDVSGKLCPGIIGWNDYYIYDTKGKITSTKNNSDVWKKFWNEI
jgi:N-acetylmuramoyl-L-alanine amidase CwlA